MSRFLGVDVGSSSIKAAVLDTERAAIEMIRSRPFPDPHPAASSLAFEVDVSAVLGRVRELCSELIGAASPCAGLVMCAQMGGLVFVDPDGRARSDYYSWRDQRSVEPHPSGAGSYFDVYAARLTADDQAAIGRELRAGSTAVLLYWLAEQGMVPAGEVFPVTLADAVTSGLCQVSPRTDPTEALGMLDLHSGDWHAPLYAAAGVERLPRSTLQDFHFPLGTFACGHQSVPVYPAVGDQQAALRGIGLREGELSINASTGSQVSQALSRLVLGDYQSRPFFGGRYLNTVTHLPAGRSLNVLADLLTEIARSNGQPIGDPWSYIAQQAALVPREELEVDLAFFAGPLGDRGRISNIRTDNLTVGALFRAAFRNMADNYLACARRLDPQQRWTSILLSGGLPQRIGVLKDMIARRFNVPLRESTTTEETLMGLLSMATEIDGSG